MNAEIFVLKTVKKKKGFKEANFHDNLRYINVYLFHLDNENFLLLRIST